MPDVVCCCLMDFSFVTGWKEWKRLTNTVLIILNSYNMWHNLSLIPTLGQYCIIPITALKLDTL